MTENSRTGAEKWNETPAPSRSADRKRTTK
eukprot:COSAG02_NODE_48761_length_331_cov_1.099138_1_plen_29_part_01